MGWDGTVVWEHVDHFQHHDFRRLPNGNTIYVAWRLLTDQEASRIPGGRTGTEHTDGIYGDVIREVTPEGTIAWEWDAVCDSNPESAPLWPNSRRSEYAHCNSVASCANGDIIVSQLTNGLVAIIDRASLQIKWSIVNHDFGTQHDAQELPNGNLLFFANGALDTGLPGPRVGSRIIEMEPTTREIVWEYRGTPSSAFFSWFVSGCQRLPSGNTLICEGSWGRIFEVTPEGEIVWDFAHPFRIDCPAVPYHGGYTLFRAYRYGADSPQIRGRLGSPL